jgi:prevent-host-death family protein
MEIRRRTGDILNRVALRGDEYLIKRKGKPLAVVMSIEKADAVQRAARLRLNEWLTRSNSVTTDEQAMEIANAARRAARSVRRGV